MTFTTRAGKGTALTHQELDDNFATLGAVHGADQVVLSVPLTVDATGNSEGFLAISDSFGNSAKFRRDFSLGAFPFEASSINQASYQDTISDMIGGPAGFFGTAMQFRFNSASHPLNVDKNGQIESRSDTFLGGFNSYISDYTDDDNFSATFNISHLVRQNQVETFPSSAIFQKDGLFAPLGITSSGNNNIGDGTGNINLNGNLFITGTNPAAPTATSDPGNAGELRVGTPDFVNFYLYLYADGLGWLRTQLSTF